MVKSGVNLLAGHRKRGVVSNSTRKEDYTVLDAAQRSKKAGTSCRTSGVELRAART